MRTSLDNPQDSATADGSPVPASAPAEVPAGHRGPPFTLEPWDLPVGGLREPASAPGPAGDGSLPEAGGPVFVDSSGRRGRKVRRLGWLLGSVCAGYATVLGVSLAGGHADAPWLLIPGQDKDPARREAARPSGDDRTRQQPRALPGRPPGTALREVHGEGPASADDKRRGNAASQRGHGDRPVVRGGHGRPARPSPAPKTPTISPSTIGHGPRPGSGSPPDGTPAPAPSTSSGPSTGPTATPTPTAPGTHPAPGEGSP